MSDLRSAGKSGVGGGYVFSVCQNRNFENAECKKLRIEKRLCRRNRQNKRRERTRFGFPVSLSTNKKGQLIIESLRFSGSSNFIAFSRADALVFIPQDKTLSKKAMLLKFYFYNDFEICRIKL